MRRRGGGGGGVGFLIGVGLGLGLEEETEETLDEEAAGWLALPLPIAPQCEGVCIPSVRAWWWVWFVVGWASSCRGEL